MGITKKYLNELTYKVIGCAIEVHKHLGPGLLESIYEKCFLRELNLRGLANKSQIWVPLEYKEKYFTSTMNLYEIVPT